MRAAEKPSWDFTGLRLISTGKQDPSLRLPCNAETNYPLGA